VTVSFGRTKAIDHFLDADNITVVIRSSGERTEGACHSLLQELFPNDHVHLVHEVPFSAALRHSLEIGLDKSKRWTLCIDADVLPHRDGILSLLVQAAGADDAVFELQGDVLDRLFYQFRPGGIHLYRTSSIPKALDLIPEPEETQRPEYTMLTRMAARGHRLVEVKSVIGLHDYEQFYRDIYRKGFFHAQKHAHYGSYLTDLWVKCAASHPDFQIALLGWCFGNLHPTTLPADVRHFPVDITALLSFVDPPLNEKEPLLPGTIRFEDVAREIGEAQPAAGYILSGGPALSPFEMVRNLRMGKRTPRLNALGPLRFMLWQSGKWLETLGSRLQSTVIGDSEMT
jgi:hypothetical protein